MVFAMLGVGTLAGVTAALVAVVGLGVPVWAGLLLWSGSGSAVMITGLALSLRREDASGGRFGGRVTA